MSLPRQVQPEWLDTLDPCDPRAVRSRRDLRRVNRMMMTRSLIGAPLDAIVRGTDAVRLVELGTGDGEMLLRLARHYAPRWPKVNLELLDLQPVVSAQTLDGYRALGWEVQVTRADVLDWLARPASGAAPIIVCNLFVHHFDGARLRALLDGIAAHACAFLCCEPRRSRFALWSSRLLGLIGCNDVTRHDALASVRAGFTARELSEQWTQPDAWTLHENAAGMFSHRLQAVRKPLPR